MWDIESTLVVMKTEVSERVGMARGEKHSKGFFWAMIRVSWVWPPQLGPHGYDTGTAYVLK